MTSELPDDVELLKKIIATNEIAISGKDTTIAELQKRNDLLMEQVRLLRHHRFARSSEKWTEEDKKQLRIFNEAEMGIGNPAADMEFETEQITYTRKKGKKGRQAIPLDLPRTVIPHEFSEQQRGCQNQTCVHYDKCEKLRPVIGKEAREEIEFIPAQIKVNRHEYYKYGSIDCAEFDEDENQSGVIFVGREKRMIPRSIVTASLLSYITVSKFADALPFYRQEKIFGRFGIKITRQNMCNWMIKGAGRCGDYLELLREYVRAGPLINMDETVLQVLHEPNRPASSRSYMWVMVGSREDGRRIVLFHYSPHHSAEIAESLLEGYRGTLQTDALKSYNSVGAWPGIWHVGCMMHSRRKFYEAHIGANKKGQAKEGLRFIKGIYRVERELRAANLSEQAFVVERRKAAAAIFRKFKKWLKATSGTVPDGSLLGKAISYTLTEYKRLVRYLKYPYLTPDNGIAERAIRPYAIGRKNWLFNNTPLGAHASAAMYSLVQTAIANNLDPYHFLWRLFTELPEADTKEKIVMRSHGPLSGPSKISKVFFPPFDPLFKGNCLGRKRIAFFHNFSDMAA